MFQEEVLGLRDQVVQEVQVLQDQVVQEVLGFSATFHWFHVDGKAADVSNQ